MQQDINIVNIDIIQHIIEFIFNLYLKYYIERALTWDDEYDENFPLVDFLYEGNNIIIN